MKVEDIEVAVDRARDELEITRELKRRGRLAAVIEFGLKHKYGIEV